MKTLSWNYRGIGNPATVRELRDLAKNYAPSVLFIMETQIDKYRVENLRYTLGFDSCFEVKSSGRSGGLGLFWKNDVHVSVQKYSNYHIDTIVSEHGKEPWRMSFIYGGPKRSLRHRTWDIMKQMRSDTDYLGYVLVISMKFLEGKNSWGLTIGKSTSWRAFERPSMFVSFVT